MVSTSQKDIGELIFAFKSGVSPNGGCLPMGGVCPGGCLPGGVSARGVCPGSLCHTPPPSACWDTNPQPSAGRDTPLVDRILDTHLWKRYLSATTVADGKKWDSSPGSSLSFPTALPITPQSQLCLWWALNFTYSMHHWFCLICLIHLIRRKCLNFEKTRISKINLYSILIAVFVLSVKLQLLWTLNSSDAGTDCCQ